LIDVGKPEFVRDQIVDVNFAVHVPVHDLWHVAPAFRTSKRGALPYATGHELKRARADLLPGARNADDHRYTPSLMAAFQRLAHYVHIAYAFEAVIRAALGQVHDIWHKIALDFVGIYEMRHTEFLRERLARRIDIDTDYHACAGEPRTLHHVES